MRLSATHSRPAISIKLGLFCLLASSMSGCSIFTPVPTDRGTVIEAMDYDRLMVGKSTRADVTSLIGSPTTHATFDDNTWIYIGEVTAPVPLARPKIETQKIVVLSFDQAGLLRARRVLDKHDAVEVAMAGGSTPSPGSETSFMQMLIGNVGRYSPLGNGSSLGGGGLGNANNGYGHGGTGNTVGGNQ